MIKIYDTDRFELIAKTPKMEEIRVKINFFFLF